VDKYKIAALILLSIIILLLLPEKYATLAILLSWVDDIAIAILAILGVLAIHKTRRR